MRNPKIVPQHRLRRRSCKIIDQKKSTNEKRRNTWITNPGLHQRVLQRVMLQNGLRGDLGSDSVFKCDKTATRFGWRRRIILFHLNLLTQLLKLATEEQNRILLFAPAAEKGLAVTNHLSFAFLQQFSLCLLQPATNVFSLFQKLEQLPRSKRFSNGFDFAREYPLKSVTKVPFSQSGIELADQDDKILGQERRDTIASARTKVRHVKLVQKHRRNY